MKKVFLLLFFCLTACAHYKVLELKDKTADQVRSSFGPPTIERVENDSKMWVYYDGGCSSLVFLNRDDVVQHAEIRCIN